MPLTAAFTLEIFATKIKCIFETKWLGGGSGLNFEIKTETLFYDRSEIPKSVFMPAPTM